MAFSVSTVLDYDEVETDDIWYNGDFATVKFKKLVFKTPILECADAVQQFYNNYQLLLKIGDSEESKWFRNLISRIDDRNMEHMKCSLDDYTTLLMKQFGDEVVVCKLPTQKGSITTEVVSEKHQFPTTASLQKGDKVVATLEFSKLWHVKGRHGCILLLRKVEIKSD